jgi:hypothetical protein
VSRPDLTPVIAVHQRRSLICPELAAKRSHRGTDDSPPAWRIADRAARGLFEIAANLENLPRNEAGGNRHRRTSCRRRRQTLTREHGGETERRRNAIMQRLFAVVLALACVVGSTPGFARGLGHAGFGHVALGQAGNRGFVPGLTDAPTPQMAPAESRIPAPLPPPEQAPVINGPMSQPAFRGLTGIGE